MIPKHQSNTARTDEAKAPDHRGQVNLGTNTMLTGPEVSTGGLLNVPVVSMLVWIANRLVRQRENKSNSKRPGSTASEPL